MTGFSRAPDPATVSRVRELVTAAGSVDGIQPLGGHLLDGLGGQDTFITTVQDAGVTVGVAIHRGADPAELVVHPEFRGRGWGRTLVDRAVAATGRVWAHGDLPAARALAASLQLTPSRTLLQLRRALPVTGEITLPAGVRLRPFVPGQDDEQFLEINARAFAWHPEQGRLDTAGLADEMAQDWFEASGVLLAVTDEEPPSGAAERVLGFHWTKVHDHDPTPQRPTSSVSVGSGPVGGDPAGDRLVVDPGPIGEVYVLAVDPHSPVRRLGTPLTLAGLAHLAGRGLDTVMLYVEADNEAAVALYRRLGFTDWITDRVYAST